MKLMVTIVVFATLIAGIGCSRQASWEAPSAGLIARNTGSLFSIRPEGTPGVALFHGGTLNSSMAHYADPTARTFNYSGTLTTDEKVTVSYSLTSSNAQTMTINNQTHDLSHGRVFLINNAGGIRQIPFAPLEASEQYVTLLEEYIHEDKPRQTPAQ